MALLAVHTQKVAGSVAPTLLQNVAWMASTVVLTVTTVTTLTLTVSGTDWSICSPTNNVLLQSRLLLFQCLRTEAAGRRNH